MKNILASLTGVESSSGPAKEQAASEVSTQKKRAHFDAESNWKRLLSPRQWEFIKELDAVDEQYNARHPRRPPISPPKLEPRND